MIAVGEILKIPFHQSNLKLGSWEIGFFTCGLSEFMLTLWAVRTCRCGVSFGSCFGDRRLCLDKGNPISNSWALDALWMVALCHKSLLSQFIKDPFLTHLNFYQALVMLMNVICKYQPECLSVAYQSYLHQLQPSAIVKGLIWYITLCSSYFTGSHWSYLSTLNSTSRTFSF